MFTSLVQWEAPQVQIRKDFKYLGIIRANPVEYVQRYGSQLKTAQELPSFVLDIKPPEGVVLAADYQYNQVYMICHKLGVLLEQIFVFLSLKFHNQF